MKGVRFYLEYPDKTEKNKATRKNLGDNHMGNVIAVLYENTYPTVRWENGKKLSTWNYDAIAGLFRKQNSPVATTGVNPTYLWECCMRISEEKAREIHPELFKILDYKAE